MVCNQQIDVNGCNRVRLRTNKDVMGLGVPSGDQAWWSAHGETNNHLEQTQTNGGSYMCLVQSNLYNLN